jgi:hypothetical protein
LKEEYELRFERIAPRIIVCKLLQTGEQKGAEEDEDASAKLFSVLFALPTGEQRGDF